jgi:hypothetical protein
VGSENDKFLNPKVLAKGQTSIMACMPLYECRSQTKGCKSSALCLKYNIATMYCRHVERKKEKIKENINNGWKKLIRSHIVIFWDNIG